MNENIEVWEGIFSSRDWGKYPPIPLVRFIARNYYSVKNRHEVRILELGCGTGANLWYCAREGFSVLGLEGSSTAMEKMKHRFEEEKLSSNILDTHVGDYYDSLDLITDNSIDAILDLESLYLNDFERSKEIVEKCVHKLKNGGRMFSMTFAQGSWGLDESAVDIGYHMVEPKKGPLEGKGMSRYCTREDIYLLYQTEQSSIDKVERQEYYFDEDEKIIKEWVVEIVKN